MCYIIYVINNKLKQIIMATIFSAKETELINKVMEQFYNEMNNKYFVYTELMDENDELDNLLAPINNCDWKTIYKIGNKYNIYDLDDLNNDKCRLDILESYLDVLVINATNLYSNIVWPSVYYNDEIEEYLFDELGYTIDEIPDEFKKNFLFCNDAA